MLSTLTAHGSYPACCVIFETKTRKGRSPKLLTTDQKVGGSSPSKRTSELSTNNATITRSARTIGWIQAAIGSWTRLG
jgi:hypothetical protein